MEGEVGEDCPEALERGGEYFMCPICFENEVNTVLVPCGHTYCKTCSESDRSRHAKCPQCRVQINARVKLYFTA